MESLTIAIPADPDCYFLEFSSKEEYLRKRSEWRQLYKWLSKVIRLNKRVRKAHQSAGSKIVDRMAKKGWKYYPRLKAEDYLQGLSEYNERVRLAKLNLPVGESQHNLDPTEMLNIRKQMKEKSSRERNQKQ